MPNFSQSPLKKWLDFLFFFFFFFQINLKMILFCLSLQDNLKCMTYNTASSLHSLSVYLPGNSIGILSTLEITVELL